MIMGRKGWAVFGLVLLVGAFWIYSDYLKQHPEEACSESGISRRQDGQFSVCLVGKEWYDTGLWIPPNKSVFIYTYTDTPLQPFDVRLGAEFYRAQMDKNRVWSIRVWVSEIPIKEPYVESDAPQKLFIRQSADCASHKLLLGVRFL
jgi:hypothetical protein